MTSATCAIGITPRGSPPAAQPKRQTSAACDEQVHQVTVATGVFPGQEREGFLRGRSKGGKLRWKQILPLPNTTVTLILLDAIFSVLDDQNPLNMVV